MSDYIYRAYWQFQKKKLVTSFFGVIIRADVCLVFPKIQFYYRTKNVENCHASVKQLKSDKSSRTVLH